MHTYDSLHMNQSPINSNNIELYKGNENSSLCSAFIEKDIVLSDDSDIQSSSRNCFDELGILRSIYLERLSK
mgnify:CR=1 FL=1